MSGGTPASAQSPPGGAALSGEEAARASVVLFWDIDGTLLTTARAGIHALEGAAEDVLGAEADLTGLQTSGLTDSEVVTLVIEHAGREPEPELVATLLRAYESHLPTRLHWRQGRVLDNVIESFEALAGNPRVASFLLTGNTPTGGRAKLRHYGLDRHIDAGAFCHDGDDRIAIARRARELAREALGRDPDEASMYVIGDSPNDVRCGKAIGARTIAVATGTHGIEELRACEPWMAVERLPAPGELVALVGVPQPPAPG